MNDTNARKVLELIRLALIGYLAEKSGIIWKIKCYTDYPTGKMPIFIKYSASWSDEWGCGASTDCLSWEDLTPNGKVLPAFVEIYGDELLATKKYREESWEGLLSE